MSRRDFIKVSGINLTGLALAACQQNLGKAVLNAEDATLLPATRVPPTATPQPTRTLVPTATFHPTQIPDLVSQEEMDFLANHEVKIGDTTRPVIMMTYDDNAKYDEIRTILDAYKAFNMKATFFFIGEKVLLSTKAVQAIVDEGHLLACHGYAHQDFMRLSDNQIHRRLEKSFAAVEEVVPGYRMRFIRFPYGSGVGSERILRVAAQWGLQHIYWSSGSNGIIKDTHETVMRNAENGAIFLSHMYREFDVTQAYQIVESLVEAGYSLETVETGRAPDDVFSV